MPLDAAQDLVRLVVGKVEMAGAARIYLAVDVGASSGRVVGARFDGDTLKLEEISRFENGGVWASGRLYWDLLRQWSDIQHGLRAASAKYSDPIASVGVDTWGVDFGLLGAGDELLGNPRHYRDPRTVGILSHAFSVCRREEIFAETGLQFMELNTLYQLLAMKLEQSPLLDAAESLLMMPDLFHWMLTGIKANEFTNASTTQFHNPRTRAWSYRLFQQFGFPERILGDVVDPGTRLGQVRTDVAEATGLHQVNVVLPGSHDTASAVLSVPAAETTSERPTWCYISSGTWSLMGVESPTPIVNDLCRELNFTNEGGVGGTTRVLKNIAGLWLVQECRRVWQLEGRASMTWDELARFAEAARPLASLVDPDASRFLAPRHMPDSIRGFCRDTGQEVPDSAGAVIRCALESLALRYRMVLGWIEQLTGSRMETIHIVGGGTQNHLLCQMTADACNRLVLAGPVEATALGNAMMQAVANGDVASIGQARQVVRESFDIAEYQPRDVAPWDGAYDRFCKLVNR